LLANRAAPRLSAFCGQLDQQRSRVAVIFTLAEMTTDAGLGVERYAHPLSAPGQRQEDRIQIPRVALLKERRPPALGEESDRPGRGLDRRADDEQCRAACVMPEAILPPAELRDRGLTTPSPARAFERQPRRHKKQHVRISAAPQADIPHVPELTRRCDYRLFHN